MFSRLFKDEDGLTTVEYALLLALLVVAAIAVWQGLGTALHNAVSSSSATLTNTMG